MSEENKLPEAAPEMQDTRTRKTVKLRAAAPITQDMPVSDPLTSRDTDTGNLEILDDTQTRKTLKLKPMAPGAAAPKINLGSEDTSTRRTVLLKPANRSQLPPTVVLSDAAVPDAGVEAPVNTPPASMPAPTVELGSTVKAPDVPKVELDDQTTAVPKRPVVPATPKVELDDKTAAVTKITAPKLPAVPVVPKVELDDQTAAVPKVPVSGQAAGDAEDQTVKMKRPPRLTPPPPSGAGPAVRPPAGGDSKATVRLSKPPTAAAKPMTVALKPRTSPGAAAPAAQTLAVAPDESTAPPQTAQAVPATPGTVEAAPAPDGTMEASPVPAGTIPAAPAPSATKPAVPKPPTAAPKPPTAAPKPPTAAPKPPTAAVKPPAPEDGAASAPGEKTPAGDDLDIGLAPSKRKSAAENEAAEGEKGEKKQSGTGFRRKNDEENENKPSVFYLILAVATLLFVAAASVITSVHYLDFEQKIKIYDKVPMLPMAK